MSSAIVETASSPSDISAVKDLFKEYLQFISDTLGSDLCFQGTDTEFATFPDIYDALFVAKLNHTVVGACGLKPFAETGSCELKRLYVQPDGRGHNFGRRLSDLCLETAKLYGYTKMYLDTDRSLTHANTIYEAMGFCDVPAYYDNPMGCTRYMALDLNTA